MGMTAAQFRAAQDALEATDDELAADLGLTPDVIRAWAAGAVRVPAPYADVLRVRAAIAERQHALLTSGLPVCAEAAARADTPLPDDPDALKARLDAADAHAATCPVCEAREQFIDARFGPMPNLPAPPLVRAFRTVERVPTWARPAVIGAGLLAGIVALRFVFILPTLIAQPGRIPEAVVALAAAIGAGAAGGLAYSLTRPTFVRLGRPGDYLTGIVCVGAYLGALVLAAPFAFGQPLVKNAGDLWVFGVLAVFFGLVVGHSWFRPRPA